jgi:hypothetical protein
MAARKTKPEGKKPDKLWYHAIMRAVNRPQGQNLPRTAPKLEYLADQLVNKAMEMDVSALKEIGDRLDGKPSQSIGLGQAPDLEPIEAAVRPTLTREAWLELHSLKK